MPRKPKAALALLTAITGCSGGSNFSAAPPLARAAPEAPASSKIRHVVIIVQENRTVDNMFDGLPGADTVGSGLNSHGKRVRLQPIGLAVPYDIGHSHLSFKTEYAKGKLDGFDLDDSRCYSIEVCIPHDVRAYGYVPRAQAQPYFVMASRYAFADRMFQTNQGPSFPAHQYIVSGTSSIANGSNVRAAENPFDLDGNSTGGCDSPAGSLVQLIDESGKEGEYAYPCFTRVALMDLLDAKSLSWRYYQADPGPGIWNAPDAILRLRKSPEFATDVVSPPEQILKDVADGELADVTWVTPTGLSSDHARVTNGSGPSWVAAVVNAIGKSPFWKNTAIFVTWDDWGGWYDHVPPPRYNSYELSFRVPLIAISPYAKIHYVSHAQHEFGSILKFVEEIFGLGSLHTTDVRADDLFDCFDFSKPPSKFTPIPAPLGPKYFLKRPFGGNPDDDGSSYTTLYSFGEPGKPDDGESPIAHLTPLGNEFYGTTRYGGSSGTQCPLGCGTIYSTSGAGMERVLYRFKGGADGATPLAAVIVRNGKLFGTTSAGGAAANCAAGCGTIFITDSSGKNERTLYNFGGGRDGATPLASLIAEGGTFYGTTQFGGTRTRLCTNGCGTVFRIEADGTSESVVHAFTGKPDGAQPVAGLVDVGGTLYGTTQYGGARTPFCAIGCGTVFKLDPSTGRESVIYRFGYSSRRPDGAYPAAGLVDAGGILYGTTLGGGASSKGAVFAMDASGNERIVHSFSCCKPYFDGANPVDALISRNGTLYGTTRLGGQERRGTIFAIAGSGTERVLYSFGDRPDGSQPNASLFALNGELYGTAAYGGEAGEGSLFALTP
jgi:phospholipase C